MRELPMRHYDLGYRTSMWVIGMQIMLMFALSTLPTPLYADYAKMFHLSGLTLTIVFSAYVVGTLSTLFFLGRLSDQMGRRKVSLAAIGLGIVAALLFLFAKNLAMLLAARIVTGLASGLSSGTAIAWMRDLYGPDSQKAASQRTVVFNVFGLGLGPLLSGLLAAFAPFPTSLVYIVFIVLLVLLAAAIFFARETVTERRSLKDISLEPRVGVPPKLRSRFMAPAVILFVTFSLVGFYSVMAPGLLAKTLHLQNLATIGSVVFELFLFGTITAYAAFRLSSRKSMLTGVLIMLPTLVLLVAAQQFYSFTALLVGTAFGGISLGLSYRGVLEIINLISPPARRAEMVSSLFVVGNLSLAIPVIGVGVLAAVTSQPIANITFAIVTGLIALIGLFLGKHLKVQTSS